MISGLPPFDGRIKEQQTDIGRLAEGSPPSYGCTVTIRDYTNVYPLWGHGGINTCPDAPEVLGNTMPAPPHFPMSSLRSSQCLATPTGGGETRYTKTVEKSVSTRQTKKSSLEEALCRMEDTLGRVLATVAGVEKFVVTLCQELSEQESLEDDNELSSSQDEEQSVSRKYS